MMYLKVWHTHIAMSAYLQTVYALDKKSGGFQSYILKMHEFSSDEDDNVWQ